MAFAFHILGTSSSGNCSILEAGGTRIMLDAGFQGPRLEASLAKLGLACAALDAVLITHAHFDHLHLRALKKIGVDGVDGVESFDERSRSPQNCETLRDQGSSRGFFAIEGIVEDVAEGVVARRSSKARGVDR